ncbi:MAG: hypothetical protein KDB22_10800 [Planctomycetales bacterium]|nr:hypothetical protein [Planctomycetales bacterium]
MSKDFQVGSSLDYGTKRSQRNRVTVTITPERELTNSQKWIGHRSWGELALLCHVLVFIQSIIYGSLEVHITICAVDIWRLGQWIWHLGRHCAGISVADAFWSFASK